MRDREEGQSRAAGRIKGKGEGDRGAEGKEGKEGKGYLEKQAGSKGTGAGEEGQSRERVPDEGARRTWRASLRRAPGSS